MGLERITDALDPRLTHYRTLRDPDHRRRGLFVVEGRLAVRQLLRSARFPTRSVLTTEAMCEGLHDLLDHVTDRVPILLATHELIREVVGFKFHRGCLAVGDRGPATAVDTLVAPPGPRVVLVLEELVDPENVGAVFRNALAFGAGAVLLSPGCGDPLARKAIRASGAGTLRVPFAPVHEWPDGLGQLPPAGYDVLALASDGSVDLGEVGCSRAATGRIALLLGNEGRGLSPEARAFATMTVRIAMAAGVDSLNVATASGIALHHLRRAGP